MAGTSDGKMLATASDDQTARLWRLPDLSKPAAVLKAPEQVLSVAVGADDELVATGGPHGFLQLWDLRSGRLQLLRDFGQKLGLQRLSLELQLRQDA